MVKYELKKDSIEVAYKHRAAIRPGVTLDAYERTPELIKAFDNKEEALKELDKHKTVIKELSNHVTAYYLVEEYYLEENTYDEDEEWIEGGDILGTSEMKIELIEKPSYNTLAVFGNMVDAVRAEDRYDGDGEVYLSFC